MNWSENVRIRSAAGSFGDKSAMRTARIAALPENVKIIRPLVTQNVLAMAAHAQQEAILVKTGS